MIRSVLKPVRNATSDMLWYATARRHASRLGHRQAPAYTRFLKHCRAVAADHENHPANIAHAAAEFNEQGLAAFTTTESVELAGQIKAQLDAEERHREIWSSDGRYDREVFTTFPQVEALLRGCLGSFYRATYRCPFKIYYGMIYRSRHDSSGPTGSQLWHADGGPGTCINTMVYLSDASPEAGAIECLPWRESLSVFARERRAMRRRAIASQSADVARATRADFYADEIAERFPGRVSRPTGAPGLVVAFRNNLLHKGGFPQLGHERTVLLFHTYPSDRSPPFERYGQHGIPKRGSYPADPAEEF